MCFICTNLVLVIKVVGTNEIETNFGWSDTTVDDVSMYWLIDFNFPKMKGIWIIECHLLKKIVLFVKYCFHWENKKKSEFYQYYGDFTQKRHIIFQWKKILVWSIHYIHFIQSLVYPRQWYHYFNHWIIKLCNHWRKIRIDYWIFIQQF